MNRRISINSGESVPQSFITKGKQRLKQHIDTVYLNNGDEFEIELFNPTNNKVLAKIEMNGNSIGSGIILRPGERVFLERYFDEAKKFLFETYIVNGNNEEVQQAIANNGDIAIKFYNEITPYYGTTSTITWTNTNLINNPFTYTTNNTYQTHSSLSNNVFYNASLTSGNSSVTMDGLDNFITSEKKSKSTSKNIETGRVEKGSKSNQTFTYDNSSFYSYPSQTNWWKIKPKSTKPMVREDLIVYCTECGSKRKKDNHKFCPHCGTKF